MLNELACKLFQRSAAAAELTRCSVTEVAGAAVIDAGIHTPGSLRAGLLLARLCLGDLATVSLYPASDASLASNNAVSIHTDDPLRACLGAQYAGWPVQTDDYFAMGSGPMRLLRGREEMLRELALREHGDRLVGVLESDKLPSAEAIGLIAEQCGVTPSGIHLGIAPSTSIAGSLQVVARSVETAMHKLHELKFDVRTIVSGAGVAPLPPPARPGDTVDGIGRTNDAILYGATVTLWTDCDDDQIDIVAARVPSSSSSDHGQPFADDFQAVRLRFLSGGPSSVQSRGGHHPQPPQRPKLDSWQDRIGPAQAIVSPMRRRRFLVLGGGEGWHANQLREAAGKCDCDLAIASYESLVARVQSTAANPSPAGSDITCQAGPLRDFDAILTRTMPAGSLEQITFRLATLHSLSTPPLINPPRSLEIAIDKFATLARVAELGYLVPKTVVVQSRAEAVEAFDELGGDCVIKPIFGGEGRGVMRVCDPQLAWYAFSTLESLDAVCYLQEFVAPGGIDTRLLVIGDRILGIRRQNENDFRTNVSSGGRCTSVQPTDEQAKMARHIVRSIGLRFASVDLIDTDDGHYRVLEVNAIPGWKGAQQVAPFNIAKAILRLMHAEADAALAGKDAQAG